jgi:hypothetical protein
MQHLGLDLGTKTIVLARKGEDGRNIFRSEINGFYAFERPDGFVRNMLVKQGIAFIERPHPDYPNDKSKSIIFALGRNAEKIAHVFNGVLRRPMADGTVSKEPEAINIMASIVHAVIGAIKEDTIIYYCIPADALNRKTNVGLHQKIAQHIIDVKKTESKILAFPINEARAIAIGTGEDTSIAISWGAGMVNVCYAKFGMSVFEFSLVGSGDKVDMDSAMAFGYNPDKPYDKYVETPTTISERKPSIDLSSTAPRERVEQTIVFNVQLLIESVVKGICDGFNQNPERSRFDGEIPITMAGGMASFPGFGEYFEGVLDKHNPPFKVQSVKVHKTPLFAVAEGCLEASHLHE